MPSTSPIQPAEPPAGLREQNKREKRERIVASARALFEAKGFESTTAREICQAAGIGTGTLFLYVKHKRELLFLVFRDDARGLFADGIRAARSADDLVDALSRLFGVFISYYARRPALSRVIVQELFFQPHDPEHMGALTLEYAGHIAGLVELAQQRGEIRRDVPIEEMSAACFAHYSFWIQGWLGSGMVTRELAESNLHRALALQVDGMSAKPRTVSDGGVNR
jgi:AcrR family transcriptional regulator